VEECAECGFDGSVISETNAEAAIRTLGLRYHVALRDLGFEENSDALRQRPNPHTWSALEYAAHMRDVIAVWGFALHRTLTENQPRLPSADPGLPDRAATEASYNTQDPTTVDWELSANADRMANKVPAVGSRQWRRTAVFGDTEVSPLWIVRKVAHEGHHHLMDISRSCASSGTA
jgi:hypothetical protein